ncbi:MAG: hypothetical protein WCI71_12940 [Bacteroidota bacterium]
MKPTFLNHFSAMEAGFSPDLLTAGYVEAVQRLCSLLPYDTASEFGFETRLGDPVASCDFFLMISRNSDGAMMLAGKSPVAGLSPELLEDPFWHNLAAMFAAWTDQDTLFAKKVDQFWLEFDCGSTAYNTTPNIFFRISEEPGLSRFAQWVRIHQVLNYIYKMLFGIDFPAELAESLKLCIESLPVSANLYQTGFMIPRKTEAIRLVLTRFDKKEIVGYLKSIGWPGEPELAEEMIHVYAAMFDYSVYNVHIGKSVLPFLGIEMYYRDMKQPQWEPRWGEIFRFLESKNLALPSKCRGMTDYCGQRTVSGLFPVRYIKGINHLKLVYKPGIPLECKGYFGTMIRKLV